MTGKRVDGELVGGEVASLEARSLSGRKEMIEEESSDVGAEFKGRRTRSRLAEQQQATRLR